MVKIIFREGEYNGEVSPFPKVCLSWEEANNFILTLSSTKKREYGCLKTLFEILYEDWFVYQGRYEVQHKKYEKADLGKHIKNIMLCYSGQQKPPHIKTEEQY